MTAQVSRSAQLSYTKQNYPLHSYMEMLYVLLMKLDSVESHGSQEVRDRRKEVTRNIEWAAERVEALVRDVWRRYSTQKVLAHILILSTKGKSQAVDIEIRLV